MEGQDVNCAALRAGVDARVRLETFKASFHQMFVDRVPPVGWALAEAV